MSCRVLPLAAPATGHRGTALRALARGGPRSALIGGLDGLARRTGLSFDSLKRAVLPVEQRTLNALEPCTAQAERSPIRAHQHWDVGDNSSEPRFCALAQFRRDRVTTAKDIRDNDPRFPDLDDQDEADGQAEYRWQDQRAPSPLWQRTRQEVMQMKRLRDTEGDHPSIVAATNNEFGRSDAERAWPRLGITSEHGIRHTQSSTIW